MKPKIISFCVLLVLFFCPSMANAAAFYSFEMAEPVISKRMIFADDQIAIVFYIPPKEAKRINFSLRNKTNKPIKLDWNKVSFISFDNSLLNIYHSGILYADAHGGKPMKETFLPPKAKLDEFIGISNGIIFTPGLYGGWTEQNIFPSWYDKAIPLVNGKFSVFLPIEINGEIKPYTFAFQITGVDKQWVPKPFVGVQGVDKESAQIFGKQFPAEKGYWVLAVTKNSPAAEQGIKVGDIIVGLNDKEIKNDDDFAAALSGLKPNDYINLRLLRGRSETVIKLKLGERQEP